MLKTTETKKEKKKYNEKTKKNKEFFKMKVIREDIQPNGELIMIIIIKLIINEKVIFGLRSITLMLVKYASI